MGKVKRVVGYVWCSPLTLVGFILVSFFSLLRWCKYVGKYDDALIWSVDHVRCPKWFGRTLHCGRAMGNVILSVIDINSDRGKIMLLHEQEHVHQAMTLGIFYPIMYGLAFLGLCFCRHAHPFYDHPFEVDAR